MEVVRTVREFALKNEEDLRRFMMSKTKIYDQDMIREAIQNFYVRLITSRSLEKFDPSKGTFKTYITNLFAWGFPTAKKRNIKTRYTFVSQMRGRDRWGQWDGDYVDVFEGVAHGCAGPYVPHAIDPCYDASHAHKEQEDDSERSLAEFIEYMSRTDPDRSKKQLIPFVQYRNQGCNGADVAKILGVSNNMIKIIKDRVRDSYEEWKGHKMNPGKKARKLSHEEISSEIAQLQSLISRHNEGRMDLPYGFVYREAITRLKYLRSKQSQLKRKKSSPLEEV